MYVKKNDWAKWTAIDEEGERCEFENKPKLTDDGWILDGTYRAAYLYTSTDSSDWKNSLIEIDAQDKPYVHEFVNDWAVAFAVDMSGKGYEYTVKELLTCTDVWMYSYECNGKGEYIEVDHEYKGDWKESLQIRKEDSEIMDKDQPNCNGEFTPQAGDICQYFSEDLPMMRKDCNLDDHCIVDTWISGDKLKVLMLANLRSLKNVPIVQNLRTSEVSTVLKKYLRPVLSDREMVIEKAIKEIVSKSNEACRFVEVLDISTSDKILLEYLYDVGMLVDKYSNSNP